MFYIFRPFFDICDGIFLNYTWKEENLKNSVESAGMRHLDVYVGVDVFGRNCYGGGGFNSYQV
jgi:mannosyl-glycoprotein endo-beta-N-acetylglucosaminidase